MDEEDNEESIKIVLLGNAVGKTFIINKYIYKNYSINDFYSSSQYFVKSIYINDKNVKLEIWDTSSQESFRCLNKIILKNSNIAVLVYDITNERSFKDLQYWYDFIKNELSQDITIGLAGNKSDLYELEEVTEKTGRECAEKWGAVFSLLSAKKDIEGIELFFMKLVKKHLEDNISKKEIIKLVKNEHKMGNNNSCYGGKNKQKEKEIIIAFLGMNGVGKTNIISIICGQKIIKK